MNKSESINELSKALSNLSEEINDIGKEKQGFGYKYAELGAVLAEIRPLLKKHGLSIAQLPHPANRPSAVRLETLLMHDSGQWLSSVIEMEVEKLNKMSIPQSYGAVITYARRYSLAAMFNIAQIDDDAAKEQRHNREPNDQAVNQALQAAPSETSGYRLDATKTQEIQLLLIEAGIAEQKLLTMTGKPALPLLSEEDYRKATDWLKRTIQKRKEDAKNKNEQQ